MLKGNIPKIEIAKKLGIARSTLYRKLNETQKAPGPIPEHEPRKVVQGAITQ
jgi:predicted DNA-binding transcriptional regulator AlpA